MEKLTFDCFTKKVFIKAPMEKLYWCWGTSAGITSWFLREANYVSDDGKNRALDENIQSGDNYTWKWHNWDGIEAGKVLKANGTDFLEISFADSKVSVSLENHETAVLLVLKQYEISTDEESKLNIHHGCSNGWTFWLTNLKAFLEHGILLNETEFDLRNIPLSGYEFVNM
nr:SRPBCC domain-containing protein [uncultured Allomuricauda sp.]